MTSNKYIADLMRPRYKVIADYPGNGRAIGEIYYHVAGDAFGIKDIPLFMYDRDLEKYPHLFKKLQWWEDRKPEEMPKYVTCVYKDFIVYKIGQVIEVEKQQSNQLGQYVAGLFIAKEKQGLDPVMNCVHYKNFTPATEQDYLNYINSKK